LAIVPKKEVGYAFFVLWNYAYYLGKGSIWLDAIN
jgi:hypothetical protein